MQVRCDGSFCSFSAERLSSGGNPGAFRQVTESFDELIIVSHWNDGFTYDPRTEGAISALDYSFDLLRVTALGTANWPLLVQDGNHYITGTSESNINDPNWTNHARSGLDPSAFVRIFGQGPARPDFSAGGAPLSFGYGTSNTSTGPTLTTVSAIDNWSVTIIPLGVPSCRFDPRNTLVPFHLSLHHVIDPERFRHLVTVEVSLNGAPPADPVDITLSASQPIFGGPSDTPAAMAAVTTDAKGKASFEFTPVPSDTLEADFSASGSVDGTPFACEGSVVVGTLPLEVSEDAADALALLGPLLRAVDVNQEYGARYEEFSREIAQVMFENRSRLSGLRDKLLHYRPVIGAVANAQPATLTRADLEEIHRALDFLELKVSRGLRNAINRLRGYLRSPDLPASFGITVEDAAPKQQRRSPRRGIQPEKYQPPRMKRRASAGSELQPDYGKLALSFEANQGQTDSQVRYLARGPGYNLYLTTREAVLVSRTRVLSTTSKNTAVRMRFVAGHARITLAFEGAERLAKDEQGDLVLDTSAGKLRLRRPFVYQEVEGARKQITGDYRLKGKDHIAFQIGPYDPSRPLIIDPVLSYSTYLGGTGGEAATHIAVDANGNAYITGGTTSANLPTEGSLGSGFAGGNFLMSDGFVTKLNAEGSALVYSTYFGGTDDDMGLGIAVDAGGSAHVTGFTRSSDFPVAAPAQPAFAGGGFVFGSDAFVLKLNPAGSALTYSTYLGGGADESAAAVALDAGGNAYVTGFTTSTDFPVTGPLQPANNGGEKLGSDAFVAKLSADGSQVVYATYLGGSSDDAGNGIAVDGGGSAYLTGVTYSADFPTANPFQGLSGGSSDAFATKLNSAGSALIYSTYLGGESDDIGFSIAVDAENSAYLTGGTGSLDFPLAGAAQPDFGSVDGLSFDAFVTKVNGDGSALVYSSYLGGSGAEFGFALAVDSTANAYVTGTTSSIDFPAANALQANNAGGIDGFLAKMTADGSALEYSSYLGGSEADNAVGIGLDPSGNVYVAGSTRSPDSPVTFGAFQTTVGGGKDVFVAKIVEGDPLPKITTVSAASFSGELGAAPDSIAAGFGPGLATGTVGAPAIPLPTSLGGTLVRVTDSAGTEHLAELFLVSPLQINYLIPEDAALGLALVIVETDGQEVARGTVRIHAVAPSLFTANVSGQGVPAARALHVAADLTQTERLIYDDTAPVGSREALPIDLGPEDEQVFLVLFGTGMRGITTGATATVGGEAVPIADLLAQPTLVGLDQANLGPLPRSLIGRGEVDILLTVDGKAANTVTANIQ